MGHIVSERGVFDPNIYSKSTGENDHTPRNELGASCFQINPDFFSGQSVEPHSDAGDTEDLTQHQTLRIELLLIAVTLW